jgi:enoyl-CoA hydratase/carnithine racemase
MPVQPRPKGESVNKFNQVTLQELNEATDAIRASSAVKGVIVTSLKKVFIVGADITEFTATFANAIPLIAVTVGTAKSSKLLNTALAFSTQSINSSSGKAKVAVNSVISALPEQAWVASDGSEQSFNIRCRQPLLYWTVV